MNTNAREHAVSTAYSRNVFAVPMMNEEKTCN
jgi:hypothetical protein